MAPLPIQSVFSSLPDDLKDALVQAFNSVRQNYVEERWEPSELNGGKVCEVTYRVMEWHSSTDKSYTPLEESIKDFRTSVRRFENNTSLSDSVRFHIPNALNFLYTVRNKRGVGHVGGEVNSNHMDAEIVLSTTNWIVAELIRVLHSTTVAEARQTIEELVQKRNPLVWEVAGVRRILNPAMSYKDQVLILLHSLYPEPVPDSDLFKWCGYSDASSFRNKMLQKAHDETFVHYDRVKQLVHLSPKGIDRAEQILLEYAEVVD